MKKLSLVPFSLFVLTSIGCSFCGAADIHLLLGVGILAILIGAFLSKDHEAYWPIIFEFMGSRTAMTATLLWLLVGVYGSILKEGHIVEGLVWAAQQLHIGGTGFTAVVFLFSGLFAISTGSGFGTISAMSLTLFPAGIAVGADASLLGGAILSGAALGDSIAPVSDTAVIAATTQADNEGQGAGIGESVRNRLPFVLTATLLTLLFFAASGLFLPAPTDGAAPSLTAQPQGLALLVPTFVVILLSLCHVNIFLSLTFGILSAVFIGLGLGLFTPSDLIHVGQTGTGGAVVEGIAGMTSICLLLMVVVSLSGLIIRSGCMESIVRHLNRRVIHSPRSAELTIFSLVAWAGILVAAVNTIANICIAPFVNSIGQQHGLSPCRRATLLATLICTFPFVLPYGDCVLLLQKGVEASGSPATLQATDVLFTAFYPWVLLVVMLLVCATGYRRKN